jgi:hypothetical protein
MTAQRREQGFPARRVQPRPIGEQQAQIGILIFLATRLD